MPRKFFMQFEDFNGAKFAVANLDIEFQLGGKPYHLRQKFALDTGAAVTIVPWKDVLLNCGLPIDALPIGSNNLKIYMGEEKPRVIPHPRFPRLDFKLEMIYVPLGLWNHPFGLLGLDFLQDFCFEFNPKAKGVHLIPVTSYCKRFRWPWCKE